DDDSPIKNTKIKVGDVITKIDGIEVHSFYELFATLDNYSIGDSIALSVCRTDKNNRDQKEYFTVTIALIGD
ncbi:PDZ domain-containing protein, partial [bacterium]|nr:PDZ domain-containing protein [bacterium]